MLKKYNIKAIKASKNIVVLLNIYYNKNIILVFYVKYNINIFQKNIVYNIKNR